MTGRHNQHRVKVTRCSQVTGKSLQKTRLALCLVRSVRACETASESVRQSRVFPYVSRVIGKYGLIRVINGIMLSGREWFRYWFQACNGNSCITVDSRGDVFYKVSCFPLF